MNKKWKLCFFKTSIIIAQSILEETLPARMVLAR
jgi:hypothetical protein